MLPTQVPRDHLRINTLFLTNYKRFESCDFDPGDFNVIVGVNGSGKSALLQALSTCLSRLTSRIVSGRSTGLQISQLDITNGFNGAALAFGMVRGADSYIHVIIRSRKGRIPTEHPIESDVESHLKGSRLGLAKLADAYRSALTTDQSVSLPVVVYYPVNRAVTDIPSRIRGHHSFDQLAAYDGAFQTQRNFRTFFEWFREREDLENEQRVDKPTQRDKQLEAVRKSIEAMMSGYSNLRVRRNPLRMTLLKHGIELRVDQLSDGEKVLLSLIGDLARRLAIANPSLSDPLEGEGIVMIDEVDLHLHPRWQRRVVEAFPQLFPNIQFFLTTHSPIIASSVRPESLWLLQDGQLSRAQAYGQDVGLVLSELFGTPPRLISIRVKLDELYEALHRSEPTVAQTKLRELESEIGMSDPELVKARTILAGLVTS